MTFSSDLQKIVPKERILEDVPAASLTTFRTGGPVDCLVQVASKEELSEAVQYLRAENIPYFLFGRGSNLLISDDGYRGVFLSLRPYMNHLATEGTTIRAEAGALLSDLAREAEANGIAGFSFLAGIPGTVGGAVFMNAGAYGGEVRDLIQSAETMKEDGTVRSYTKEEMELSYRHSVFCGRDEIILSAVFSGTKGDPAVIRKTTEELLLKRKEKQPLEFGSAGSVFKRPEGFFAGKLIEDAGLRGTRIGDAEVSEKHAGFIVNRGRATSSDVYRLIEYVQKTVKERSGVELQPEIRFLGEF